MFRRDAGGEQRAAAVPPHATVRRVAEESISHEILFFFIFDLARADMKNTMGRYQEHPGRKARSSTHYG